MFKTRLISAIVMIAILLFAILEGGYILAGLVLLVSLVSYRELMKAFKLSGTLKSETKDEKRKNIIGCFTDLELIGYAGIIVYVALVTFTNEAIYLLTAIFGILIAYMFLYVFSFPKHDGHEIATSMFCVIYAPVMITFAFLITKLEYGIYFIWIVFIWSAVCDIFAYCVGVLFGKHKLAPKLSPKKSIEGAIGGAAFAGIGGFIYGFFVLEPAIKVDGIAIILGVVSIFGAIISQVGDLCASAIKRNQDIKDYGKLIPGHGGVMDRLDSIVMVSPVVYLFARFIIDRCM